MHRTKVIAVIAITAVATVIVTSLFWLIYFNL